MPLQRPEVGINPPPPPFPHPPHFCFSYRTPGANQQIFVPRHLTSDLSVKERERPAWGVSEVQRTGVAASERKGQVGGGQRKEKEKGGGGEKGKPATKRCNKLRRGPFSFFFSVSCIPVPLLPTWTRKCFRPPAGGAAPAGHRSLWLDVCEECTLRGSTRPTEQLHLPINGASSAGSSASRNACCFVLFFSVFWGFCLLLLSINACVLCSFYHQTSIRARWCVRRSA